MMMRLTSTAAASAGMWLTLSLAAAPPSEWDDAKSAPKAPPKLKPSIGGIASSEKAPPTDKPVLEAIQMKEDGKKPILPLPMDAAKTEFKTATKLPGPAMKQGAEPPVADEKRVGVSSSPSVELRQSMPSEVRFGQPVGVDLVVVNNGSVMVDKVIVTQDMPKGVDLLSASPMPARSGDTLIWSLGEMEPRQSRSIKLKLGLRMGEAEPELKCNARVKYESSVASVAKVYQPKLVVETTSPLNGVVNGKVKLEIKITNTGNTAAKSVLLRAPLPPELAHQFGPDLENDLGRLEPGESRLVPLTMTGVKPGKSVSRIMISTEGAQPVEKVVPVEILQVQLGLAAKSPKTRFLHRPNEYAFTVTNKGAAEASEARLTAALPKGVSFVHASDAGQYDATKHEVVWAVGNVKPGETREITMTGVATELGDQECKALLSANGIQHEAAARTMVQGVAAMQMEVIETVDPLEVGGTTIYSIKLVNQGSAVQTGIELSCICPPELQPLDTRAPTKHRIEGQKVIFEKVATLEPRDELVFKVKCKALKPGDARFKVEAVSDQQKKPLVKEEATRAFGDDVPQN
jgi:uncharacterized repeat protein (TIGR01451 family)